MTHDETTAAVRRGLLTEDAREVYKRPGGVGPHTCPRCGRTAHGVSPTVEGCPGSTLPTAELEHLRRVEAKLVSYLDYCVGLGGGRLVAEALDELRAVLGNRA